jgi:flagellar biosynthetic protein FliQ
VDATQLGQHVLEALQLACWLAAPALLASMLAGLVTGALQAATQVQDPALSFVPRLLAVAVALVASGAWMQTKLVAFTSALFADLSQRAP